MKLIDTSSWIEQLRRDGDATVRVRVEELLSAGEAAWCPIVRLELWNGARGEAERQVLREMEADIPTLEIGTTFSMKLVPKATLQHLPTPRQWRPRKPTVYRHSML